MSTAPHCAGWRRWARAKSRCWASRRRTSFRPPLPLWTSAWTTQPWTPAWSATARLPTTTMLCAIPPHQYNPPGPTTTTTRAAGNLSDSHQVPRRRALLPASPLISGRVRGGKARDVPHRVTERKIHSKSCSPLLFFSYMPPRHPNKKPRGAAGWGSCCWCVLRSLWFVKQLNTGSGFSFIYCENNRSSFTCRPDQSAAFDDQNETWKKNRFSTISSKQCNKIRGKATENRKKENDIEKFQIIFFVATFSPCWTGRADRRPEKVCDEAWEAPSESEPSSSTRLEFRVEPEVLFVMSQWVFLRLSSLWSSHRLRGV